MGISDRRERERQEMKALITGAAKELFLTEGYERVSIRAIAERIEYSPATIYLYFKDKDEILFALHNEGFDKLFALQRSTDHIADPLERLRREGEEYVRFALENPELYDLMLIQRAPARVIASKEEWVAGGRSYDHLRRNVRECIETGAMPAGDLEVATFAMWSIVHGMVSLIIRDRCSMVPPDMHRQIANGALEYLMATMEKLAARE